MNRILPVTHLLRSSPSPQRLCSIFVVPAIQDPSEPSRYWVCSSHPQTSPIPGPIEPIQSSGRAFRGIMRPRHEVSMAIAARRQKTVVSHHVHFQQWFVACRSLAKDPEGAIASGAAMTRTTAPKLALIFARMADGMSMRVPFASDLRACLDNGRMSASAASPALV